MTIVSAINPDAVLWTLAATSEAVEFLTNDPEWLEHVEWLLAHDEFNRTMTFNRRMQAENGAVDIIDVMRQYALMAEEKFDSLNAYYWFELAARRHICAQIPESEHEHHARHCQTILCDDCMEGSECFRTIAELNDAAERTRDEVVAFTSRFADTDLTARIAAQS